MTARVWSIKSVCAPTRAPAPARNDSGFRRYLLRERLPSVAGEGPMWLPPVAKSALAEWARSRAAAVQALIDRYPAELSALDDGWAKDAAVRE